uniref:F-box protein 4 n=1 Tax=Laticauda laticaudata TaxID=8630 RepID=A0A8C5S2H1_LATLA
GQGRCIPFMLEKKELIYLGSTNHYWRITVQDPLLWRYFLIRDLPSWNSIDCESLPDAKIFNQPFMELDISPCNFMAAYKKCCSFHKRFLKPNRTTYSAMSSFLQSLIPQTEPCFAMFGPGLEDLDQSLVYTMMASPDILPLAGMPSRQIQGIGSGVTFNLNCQNFNIQTLVFFFPRKERQRDKAETNSINKMFYEVSSVDGTTQYKLIEHVRNVCRLADGFIYVADAEDYKRHNRQIEFARMSAMLDPTLGPLGRPLLVLSCISCASKERIPCVYLAHQLQLNLLDRLWMVQDIEAATLVGLLDGIQWLLEHVKH